MRRAWNWLANQLDPAQAAAGEPRWPLVLSLAAGGLALFALVRFAGGLFAVQALRRRSVPLFDNRWLYLFALDDHGRMAWRYAGDLTWEVAAGAPTAEPTMAYEPERVLA